MKILRYEIHGKTSYGTLEKDGSIHVIVGSPFQSFTIGEKIAELEEVRLLAPVVPSKIIGVGANYVAHIEETGLKFPKFPMLFMKPPTSVTDPRMPIIYPYKAKRVDYEAELAAVIGKATRHVSESQALEHVFGFTCGNDVSERTIQFAEMEMGAILVGKGFDTFCPLGPVIQTELDPTNTHICSRLNGEIRQDANTSDMLFSVARLVSYLSEAMLLLPGDVIMTGTPAGIGPMAVGDTVEIDIEGIGVLENMVMQEEII